MSYINNEGGSVLSLFEIAKDIFLWFSERNSVLSAVHIAGKNMLLQIIYQDHSVIQPSGN